MSKPTPLLMCTSCGAIQERESHLCAQCGAPLTPHAHNEIALGIQTRGFALHKATSERPKRVVVIGVWFWMLPILLFGFGGLFFVMSETTEVIFELTPSHVLAGLLISLLSVGAI